VDAGLTIEFPVGKENKFNKFYLSINDKDSVICKDYPKDDMDWLHGKPIMYSFYKELEDFGLVRDRDFKIFGGGTGVNIVFDDKSVIKLWKLKKYDQFLTEQKENTLDIPNDVLKISEAYRKAGKDIFLVGGAVRDYIQGITPKDYDLVTNALIDESKEILKDFNVSDEQGKSFGVIRVYTKECPEGHEIASYRKDISGGRDTKGEEDKVEMGQHITMEDDCNRRDLTMNALYYDINKKEIIDLVGGVDDIKKGIVKAVGNASERFLEDRLRILRIFRFTARTGGRIDKETSDAIKKDNRLIGVGPKDDVSQERIWEELEKSYKQSKNIMIIYPY